MRTEFARLLKEGQDNFATERLDYIAHIARLEDRIEENQEQLLSVVKDQT